MIRQHFDIYVNKINTGVNLSAAFIQPRFKAPSSFSPPPPRPLVVSEGQGEEKP